MAKDTNETCPHNRRLGDNYGECCAECGAQLRGYGYGGWFGSRLTGRERCRHEFFECDGQRICRFCEKTVALDESEAQ